MPHTLPTAAPYDPPLPVDRRSVFVGIVGDSGSGRSTLARALADVALRDLRVTHVRLDDYHVLARAERWKRGVTALSPSANDLALAAAHLDALHRGDSVDKPVYRHATGTIVGREVVMPASVVVATGLLGYATPTLHAQYDVRIFLDPDPELRDQWKRGRDTRERGYDDARVCAVLEARRDDRARHVQPQRAAADLVLSVLPQPGYWSTRDDAGLHAQIAVRRADLADLVGAAIDQATAAEDRPLLVVLDNEADGDLLTFRVDGRVTAAALQRLADALDVPPIPPMPASIAVAALIGSLLVRRAQAEGLT